MVSFIKIVRFKFTVKGVILMNFKNILFVIFVLGFCENLLAEKLLKMEYAAKEGESIEKIVDSLIKNKKDGQLHRESLIEDIKKRNPNVKNWDKMDYAIITIILPKLFISEKELEVYILKQEVRKKEIAVEIKKKEEEKQGKLKIPNRYSFYLSPYTKINTEEVNDYFLTGTSIVPSIYLKVDFETNFKMNIFKKLIPIKASANARVGLLKEYSGISVPAIGQVDGDISYSNFYKGLSAGVMFSYEKLSVVSKLLDGSSSEYYDVRNVAVLFTGIGLEYDYIYKKNFGFNLSAKYLFGIISSSSLEVGSAETTITPSKYNISLVTSYKNKYLFEIDYSSLNANGDIELSMTNLAFFIGMRF